MAHGAVGLTAATLVEAEVFAEAGVGDLLIAHPPVGTAKLRRLEALASRVRRLAVSLDDVGVAESLPSTIEVLWEVDTGLHRIGTPPGLETVAAVRRLIAAIGPSRFRGLITHAGHVYAATNQAERQLAAEQESAGLTDTAEMLRAEGIEARERSVGSTPTAGLALRPGITEMRPGTYVYGDANQVTLGSQRLEDCALAVIATVVSTPSPDRAVVDAGSKALSADLRVSGLDGYGIVVGNDRLCVARLSEEHAVVTAPDGTGLAIGDRIVIIPAHACTTVNLHPSLLVAPREGAARWQAVDARGWR
jgi:D-serine deaminase-like pyridoxal phosphate-dependent protein